MKKDEIEVELERDIFSVLYYMELNDIHKKNKCFFFQGMILGGLAIFAQTFFIYNLHTDYSGRKKDLEKKGVPIDDINKELKWLFCYSLVGDITDKFDTSRTIFSGTEREVALIRYSFGICFMIAIILTIQECNEKVLMIGSSKKKLMISKIFLWFQILVAEQTLFQSNELLRSKKTTLEMLIDLTALWTLNSLDNFAFIMF